jgi:hypothetical protein
LLIKLPDDLPAHLLEPLVQHRGPLQIAGIRTLDASRARLFASQPCLGGVAGLSYLALPDVAAITPPVAAILAAHRAGGLAMDGLKTMSVAVAREIVRHPLLALDGLESVTDPVATILATYRGHSLSLRRLRQASPAAVARLRDNPGIELPSL